MKSHLDSVLDVYEGIFLDASRIWPVDTMHFGKDMSYLRRAAKERGLSFFTITLPAYGKVIDRSLAIGSFLDDELPRGIPSFKRRPKFLGEFHKKVFDDSGTLLDDPCTLAIGFLRQIAFLSKKLRLQCSPQSVKETLDEFYQIEDRMLPPWPDTWDSDAPVFVYREGHPLYGNLPVDNEQYQLTLDNCSPGLPTRDIYWNNLRQLCRRVVSELGIPNWWELRPKHGPGVVSEQSGFVSKYEFPNWPRKLDGWFPYDWFGSGVLDDELVPSDREPPSRLIAVPKTQKGPRLICAEPTSHQWMQQGIWRWLDDRVRSTVLGRAIRFRDQEFSKARALNASTDGKLCTIDLSSASDRISCRLVEYVFQGSEILEGMHACRTRLLSQNISPDHPKIIRIKKFSTMGSALTFPVQSIIFSILTVHALRVSEGREDDWSDWEADFDRVTVFGDDIIAPTHSYEAIVSVLTECGLKVNMAKSFRDGLFRESCGMDAYSGVDVTPSYLLEAYNGTATSMAATIEASNNFYKRGYWNAASVIANFLPPQELKLLEIVGGEVGGLGLYSFQGGSREHLQRRWNPLLHRDEYIALKVTSKVTKEQGTGFSGLTQYFTERPDPDIVWSSGQVRSVRTRKVRARVS